MRSTTMKLLVLVTVLSTTSIMGKNFDFEYIKTVNMNETNEIFEYTVNVEAINETAFKINADSELKVTLDDEYAINIIIYQNEEGKEEFDVPLIEFPTKKVCDFLKTTYKKHFFDRIKDTTNFPHYETCPIEPNKFWMKDHIFNGENYKAFVTPGLYKVVAFISLEGETRGGVEVYSLVQERTE